MVVLRFGVALALLILSHACTCSGPVDGEDAGFEGEGEGEGEGGIVDAGNGFDLGSLLDGGLPDELSCLPDQLPELSIAGALDALGLTPYTGSTEDGVRCGPEATRVTCDEGVPCCVLCGFGACAGFDDAGVRSCPSFTVSYACDGPEECPGDDVCCFTLSGTECRVEQECNFDVGAALGPFLGDGGIRFPDAGFFDGGFLDGGFLDGGFVDGGFADGGFLDGGFDDAGAPIEGEPILGDPLPGPPIAGEPLDGGPGPLPDAGSFLDALQTTLDQGVPVCRSTFQCDLFSGELCCTSDRLTAVDVGFCMPGLLCLGDILP